MQEYFLSSVSTCKTVDFIFDRLCGLPDSRRRASQFLLERVEGSKGNEKKKNKKRVKKRKGEKQHGMSIHPVASTTPVLGNPVQLPNWSTPSPASCPLSSR